MVYAVGYSCDLFIYSETVNTIINMYQQLKHDNVAQTISSWIQVCMLSACLLKVTDDGSLLKLGYEKEINVYVVRKHGFDSLKYGTPLGQ